MMTNLDLIMSAIFNIIGFGILIWTVVTILKTDGLFKYKYNPDTDETEEVANND